MKIIINNSLMIPIYEQIVDQIKTLIRKGELKENDNLPSVRALARELKISALTVKKPMTIWRPKVLPLRFTAKGPMWRPPIQNGFWRSRKGGRGRSGKSHPEGQTLRDQR